MVSHECRDGVPLVCQDGVPLVCQDGVPLVCQDGVPRVCHDGVPLVCQDGVPLVCEDAISCVLSAVSRSHHVCQVKKPSASQDAIRYVKMPSGVRVKMR